MITIIQNAITDSEIKEFIDYYDSNLDKVITPENEYSIYIYKYKGMSIIDNMNDFSFLRRIRYKNYDRLRIQEVDNTIDMVLNPHTHTPPFAYSIFLNDNYEGGEFIMDNITFKPKIGQMVYFSREEGHYVNNVISGRRLTLVGFTKDNTFRPTTLNII
jgi:hypothetical protein